MSVRDRMAGMSYSSHRKIRNHRHVSSDMVRRSQPDRRRSMLLLILLLIVWSICLGMGLAQATEPRTAERVTASESVAQVTPNAKVTETGAIGTVDTIPPRFQAGQKLYLENCATCHIGIPPAVMPSQTWQQLIQDAQHYGATIQPLRSPEIQILWQYLREYSRPLAQGESTPYRIRQSQIFKALHPRVTFTEKVTLTSCNSCHPGAEAYDFRSLTAEWQNAP